MDRLTSASKARYSLRRLALKTIEDEIAKIPDGEKKPTRIYNIVNQSDPDDLFAQFSEEEIIKFFSGEKDLPKPLTGTSASSPDAALFKKLKRFLFEEQHHVNPLGQNANAINPDWDDAELHSFHRTLNDFDTGSGSSYMSLRGYDKSTHLNKVHGGKTKQQPFPSLSNVDPELAAVEFWVNNTGNRFVAEKYYADPTTFANQILSTEEGTPLRVALEKAKGNPRKFEEFLRDMDAPTRAQAVGQIDAKPDLMGMQKWGNQGTTEKEMAAFRNQNPDLYPPERVAYMGPDGVLRSKVVRGVQKILTPGIGGAGMALDAWETATRAKEFKEDPNWMNATQLGLQVGVQVVNGVMTVVPAAAPIAEPIAAVGEAVLMGTDIAEHPEEAAAAARAVPRPTSMLTGAL